MDNLEKLYDRYLQSPWLDNLSRDLLASGKLKEYVRQGIRGLTSNPTIMEKAITESDAYDEQIMMLAAQGLSNEAIYWKIVEDDIKAAAALLEPIWKKSNGLDGYVSLEVSPELAMDTEGTVSQARQLWKEVNKPNVMIKVPATDAGVPTVHTLLLEGINVNVTLIFSLEHYEEVAKAHRASHALGHVNNARSVASFFVSRVDTEVDKRLEAIDTEEALALRGKAAIAQAHLAYGIFLKHFADAVVLDPDGPAVQRLLWASTSTKNPAYDDLLYVSGLIAPYTINTLPEATIAGILDHLPESLESISLESIAEARRTMRQLENVGIDLDDVSKTLEEEGVKKFNDSFASLIEAIERKRSS